VTSVHEYQVAAEIRVRPNERRHRSHRVAEVDEEAAGKAAGNEFRHLGRVRVPAYVERVNHDRGIGREEYEAGMAKVEAALAYGVD